MGFESVRVELRGGRASRADADEVIRSMPGVTPDPNAGFTPGATCFTFRDGRHAIELEVTGPPVKVSCRFALCNAPSVVRATTRLVRELMIRLGMEPRICDDVPDELAGPFSPARFAEFVELFTRCATARRAEWAANFGPDEFPATTREAFERLILPHREPVVG